MDEKASPAAFQSDQPAPSQVEVIALQPLAVVDHLCSVTEDTLRAVLAHQETGGSRRVSQQQVQELLAQIGEFHSKAGGSNANTIRGAPELHAESYTTCQVDATNLMSVFGHRLSSRLWCQV